MKKKLTHNDVIQILDSQFSDLEKQEDISVCTNEFNSLMQELEEENKKRIKDFELNE